MNDSTLKNLLKEYDKKRQLAFLDLDKRKQELFSSNKRLEEIDNEINSYSIQIAKTILSSPNNTTFLDSLRNKIDTLKNEKNTIIKNLNIDDDFFKPHFECNLCNDTGYVQDGYNFNLCSCIKQKLFDIEYNKSNVGNLEKDNFDNFNLNLYSNTINEDLYSSNLSPRDNIKNIKKIALSFINNFDNSNEKNLLFTGNTGLGKTFLSNCIANELLKKGKTVLY